MDTELFDYSMWAWCGQLSYYGSSQVDAYLAALNTLDGEYSDTEFIYMDGAYGTVEEPPSRRTIRGYATTVRPTIRFFLISRTSKAGT